MVITDAMLCYILKRSRIDPREKKFDDRTLASKTKCPEFEFSLSWPISWPTDEAYNIWINGWVQSTQRWFEKFFMDDYEFENIHFQQQFIDFNNVQFYKNFELSCEST